MLRAIVMTVLILVSYLLQCTLFQTISLASVAPNLLIIITFTFGFVRGKKNGMLIGFFCGLLVDLFFGYAGIIGINAMIYMYIGYFNGLFSRLFYVEEITLPLFLVIGSDFAYNLIYYVFAFLIRNKLDFVYYFKNIMVPEMIYTVVIAILVYRALLKLNKLLEEYEKRRESKFV